MIKKKVPKRLWDYGFTWICETYNLLVSSSHYAQVRTALEYITGETPDISEYLDFSFYDLVLYRSNAGLGEVSIGRWLGVSHKVGQLMSYWILPESGKVISCTTVQRLSLAAQSTQEYSDRIKEFDLAIKRRLNVNDIDLNDQVQEQPDWNRLSLNENDQDFIDEFVKTIDDETIPEGSDDINKILNDLVDNYLSMEVELPRGPNDELV